MNLKAVFFDLDGTLLDTAPDLAHALDQLLVEENFAPIEFTKIRQVVSDGAYALIKLGFNVDKHDPRAQELRQRLLNFYEKNLAQYTQPFDGINELIALLAENNIRWGIVTNKPWQYTEPLMKFFSFASNPSCVLSPEHVKQRKPDPESLFLACKKSLCNANEAIYIGDHIRDIECGKKAGMPTIAAHYGYINEGDDPQQWNANYNVQSAKDIWPIITTILHE